MCLSPSPAGSRIGSKVLLKRGQALRGNVKNSLEFRILPLP